MQITDIQYKGHASFRDEWSSCLTGRPISIIIGRNNTGKSALLSLVRACCEGLDKHKGADYLCSAVLDEASLRGSFPESTSGGSIDGNHWRDCGVHLIDCGVTWEIGAGGGIGSLELEKQKMAQLRLLQRNTDGIIERLRRVVERASTPYAGYRFLHLFADRDIRREPAVNELVLSGNGDGATNIIRRMITSANPELRRELIGEDLRGALNEIMQPDSNFSEIFVRQHDDRDGEWEVYLGEANKGLVALSQSGSGLKTLLLVLLHLKVVPVIEKIDPSRCVYAFEELENNLHPAILRRLYRFIERFAKEQGATFFLTTHSSVALDTFGVSDQAGIVLVAHDGRSARTTAVSAHLDRLGVVRELGARPSDLLQSNGVVWVEGPSDAIYINKWIELLSDGELREGRDYVCAFFGGALLSRLQVVEPVNQVEDMVNLLTINPNLALVCDSDRSSDGDELKGRVERISEEIGRVPGSFMWVTSGKEIENYLSGSLLARAFDIEKDPNDPKPNEFFFPSKRSTSSYWAGKLGRKSVDKVELASRCIRVMTVDDIDNRLGLRDKVSGLIDCIKRWAN